MRRTLAVILILVLLFCIPLGSVSADTEVCFITINETLLELSTAPYFYGGVAYVPYSVFGNLKIYPSYFPAANIVSLSRSDKQIYFELTTGKIFDGEDNYYVAPIVSINGNVYLSVQFVCNFFGLNWSYIKGLGYGDILRITDNGSYLNDSAYLSNAKHLMKFRYDNYIAATVTPTPVQPEPSPTNSEVPVIGKSRNLYLSFTGSPSDGLLNTLSSYTITATFYLTPEEIAENPGTVRKLIGSGHSLGIYCTGDFAQDYARGAELAFEAAQIVPIKISASYDRRAACAAYGNEAGLSFKSLTLDASKGSLSQAVSHVETSIREARIRLSAKSATGISSFIKTAKDQGFVFRTEYEA